MAHTCTAITYTCAPNISSHIVRGWLPSTNHCCRHAGGGRQWMKIWRVAAIILLKADCFGEFHSSNNNNKRPLTPKSMPPAGDEHIHPSIPLISHICWLFCHGSEAHAVPPPFLLPHRCNHAHVLTRSGRSFTKAGLVAHKQL